MTSSHSQWSKRSLTAQAMGHVEPVTKGVVMPIHVSTTYIRDEDNAYSSGFVYGRPDNATIREAEGVLAMLEEAKAGALLFSSGMAAATAVFQALNPGDHVVASKVMYWALRHWLLTEATRWGLQVEFVETDDLEPFARPSFPAAPNWSGPRRPRTRSGPSPTSRAQPRSPTRPARAWRSIRPPPRPTIPALVARRRHRHARGDKSPERSLGRGGGGAAGAKADAFWAQIVTIRKGQGAILGPFEAYLLMRGMRTLHLRAAAQAKSAQGLAERLAAHPRIARVLYPGLPQHPGHDVAARQMENGFGYMLSVQVSDGEAAAIRTAARVKLWKRATSLGGVESLIEHRASIEGPGTPCPPDLLRLSTGIEDPEDLFADLDAALRATKAARLPLVIKLPMFSVSERCFTKRTSP